MKVLEVEGLIEGGIYRFQPLEKKHIHLEATIFYYDKESSVFEPMVIDEVYNLDDEFKAFSANGCRYGLNGFYVMKYY